MKECQLYEQIATYLQLQYPDIIYRFDLAADLKLTPGQAIRHKKLHPKRGYPDLVILQSRKEHALFIEVKKDGTKLKREKDCKKILKGDTKLRKAGDWWDLHIEEQAEMLENLRDRGYKAEFAVGFEEAKRIIDNYLKGAND